MAQKPSTPYPWKSTGARGLVQAEGGSLSHTVARWLREEMDWTGALIIFYASTRNKPENHGAETSLYHNQCPTPTLPIPFMSAVYPMGHSIRLVVIVSSEGRICLNMSVGSNLLMCCG